MSFVLLFPEVVFWQLFVVILCIFSLLLKDKSCLVKLACIFFPFVILFSGNNYPDYGPYSSMIELKGFESSMPFPAQLGYSFTAKLFFGQLGIKSYELFLFALYVFSVILLNLFLKKRVLTFPTSVYLMCFGTFASLIFIGSSKSGLSFILAICALIALLTLSDKYNSSAFVKFLFLLYLSLSFHIQFVLQLLFLFFCAGISRLSFFIKRRNFTLVELVASLSLLVAVLFFLLSFSHFLASSLETIGLDETNRFYDSQYSKLRSTFLLSLAYPLLLFSPRVISNIIIRLQPRRPDFLLVLLRSLAISGAFVNIVFVSNNHVSGRLSRLSEYTFICILPIILSSFVTTKYRVFAENLICLALVIIYPILYPGYFKML